MSSAINIVPSTSFFDLQYIQVYSVYTSFAVLIIFLFLLYIVTLSQYTEIRKMNYFNRDILSDFL